MFLSVDLIGKAEGANLILLDQNVHQPSYLGNQEAMSESCGNPTVESEVLMPRRKKYDKTKTCVKCKESQGNLVIRHAVYCKDCFSSLLRFKFRRSIEPFVNAKPDGPRRTALKPTGNLLIGFSGGLGSSVLLDLIHRHYVAPDKTLITEGGGSHHPRHERVWPRVIVCYVEVCDAFPLMKDRTSDIREVAELYGGLEFIPLRIQDAFDPKWWQATGHESDPTLVGVDMTDEGLPQVSNALSSQGPLTNMRTYISSLPTATARSTSLQNLTRLLLQYTALSNNCSHLVLGTSLTSLAISLISNVSHGGGFHIKEEIQEEWIPSRHSSGPLAENFRFTAKKGGRKQNGIRIIRPLRDVGMKECGAWSWWMGLKVIHRESWDWPGSKPGITSLTKEFIAGLEKDFPSTVSTIVRTCGKLAPKGNAGAQCISCERPIQEGIHEWKAQISIRSLSNDLTPLGETLPCDTIQSISPHLCYVCHTTFTSRSSRPPTTPYPNFRHDPGRTPLPLWSQPIPRNNKFRETVPTGEESVMVRQLERMEMKDTLKGFLLDDE